MKRRSRMHGVAPISVALALCGCVRVPTAAPVGLHNSSWRVALMADRSVTVQRGGLDPLSFAPTFTVLFTRDNPQFELRWAGLGDRRIRNSYNVASWVVKAGRAPAQPAAGTPAEPHVADGFDLQTDRVAGKDRTFDAFGAAPRLVVLATRASVTERQIVWEFAPNPRFELRAVLELPEDQGLPVLRFAFTPKVAGWFSVAYSGAPAVDPAVMEEMWQPLIWQEKRFPTQPYLTEAGRCTLPGTLVAQGGLTWGVLADPEELPFQPMPTPANSRFGVLVRSVSGTAQPTVFAPILGGAGSKMQAGATFTFRCRLHISKGDIVEAYEQLARGTFGFRDYRQNHALGSLNQTLERMADYAMSPWARFDEELRGSAYETDVPGSVKNVSALHPLSAALILDDPQYFERRAKPLLEYALSREKFLFTTDPAVRGQGASARLAGPCAPVSELAALYEFSGRRSPVLRALAQQLFRKNRTLNLDDEVAGGSWQNALALYRATDEPAWLQQARAGAEAYLQARFENRQTDFSDPGARGMCFWTSYGPNWMELYELFEATGEPRYLAAAYAGARRFAQFVWMCPVIPEGDILVNQGGQAPQYRQGAKYPPIPLAEETVPAWRLSEIGLTCEGSSTSKGHRGILLATHAPWMLRLAQQTGSDFLHAIGRAAIVGRYTSFPGYHMNTARTTVYEKPDFAQRPTAQINSASSLHYNHIWPHIALLLDYLISDAYARSAGAIDFPSHFAEGYAYLQSKVYGDRPGKFYGEQNVWLWMPKGLLACDQPEINYVAARGADTLYLALMNQGPAAITVNLALNPALAALTNKTFTARVWRNNKPAGTVPVESGRSTVAVAAKGLTALAIDGLQIAPRFQSKLHAPAKAWAQDFLELELGGARAMVLNFGRELTWAYVYLQERALIKQATLHYTTGGAWQTVIDTAFPFEFSAPLPSDAKEFAFRLEVLRPSGEKVASEIKRLHP